MNDARARDTDPQTAHDAAALAPKKTKERVLDLIIAAGDRGMTLDDLEDALPQVKMVSFSSIPARLCDEYLIHRSNQTRMGRSNREQLVYKGGMGDAETRIDRQARARAVAARPAIEITNEMIVKFKEQLWISCAHDPMAPLTLQPVSRFADWAIRSALEECFK